MPGHQPRLPRYAGERPAWLPAISRKGPSSVSLAGSAATSDSPPVFGTRGDPVEPEWLKQQNWLIGNRLRTARNGEMVRDRGLETLTPSVSRRCSTTELTAPNRRPATLPVPTIPRKPVLPAPQAPLLPQKF